MDKIGLKPFWKSNKIGDKILVAFFTALYIISYIPMHVCNRLFNKTRLNWFMLDLLTIPGKLLYWVSLPFGKKAKIWGAKANALGHTHFTCRLCPSTRQATRDPAKEGNCAWNAHWNLGNFHIPADFGTKNYFKQYFNKQDLNEFQHLLQIK